MTFSYVDLNLIIDEEYKHLLSINRWIDKDSQVYVVKDQGDIKSVFCLTPQDYYTKFKLCFGTKEQDRNKGYCSFGLYMLLDFDSINHHLLNLLDLMHLGVAIH